MSTDTRESLNTCTRARDASVLDALYAAELSPEHAEVWRLSTALTDLYNALGERYALFAGLDDVALEGLMLGAKGWVSAQLLKGSDEPLERAIVGVWD